MKEMSKNKNLLLLTVCFSSMIGLLFSLGNIMSSLFQPFGFEPSGIALIGLIMLVSGVFGATFTGIILDKTAAFKRMIQVSISIFTLSLCLIIYFLLSKNSHTLVFTLMVPFGFSLVSILPSGLGLGVELTFPKLEPTLVNGIMLFFAQLQCVLQSLTYSVILDTEPAMFPSEEELKADRIFRASLVQIPFLLITVISMAAICFVKEELNRRKHKLASDGP